MKTNTNSVDEMHHSLKESKTNISPSRIDYKSNSRNQVFNSGNHSCLKKENSHKKRAEAQSIVATNSTGRIQHPQQYPANKFAHALDSSVSFMPIPPQQKKVLNAQTRNNSIQQMNPMQSSAVDMALHEKHTDFRASPVKEHLESKYDSLLYTSSKHERMGSQMTLYEIID